ncbi:DUF1758 domain-containing protein [Trichonephila inaurata madagascariensis]|uniref:DUF1758 domain-containing protein n=1 Tax=Trichonephila inaurata madagascariensis TaxID=2747483 RepID=A0A8X6WRW4_9ARAC|nr:DUF1758 domain-containing protein [Trichonephila inaurata madagascariensis]
MCAFKSSNRYAFHPSSPIDVSRFAKRKRMKLADPDDSLSNLPIEVLIGAGFYWNVMHSDALVKLSDSLALVPSSFGWSDGSQSFFQLILADEDRDVTRFLWYKTEYTSDGKFCTANEIVTYRFTRLPLGLTLSPFLLSASLRELAKHIGNNTYMDDFVMGTSTDTEAIILYREILQLTSRMSLPLAKWMTNSKILQDV